MENTNTARCLNDSNPTQPTRPNGSRVNRTFDTFGNVLTQTEQFNTARTTYTYDPFSLVTSVRNPRNHTTTTNRDPVTGNPTSIVNHLGHTTTMEYDARGLVTEMTSPNGLVTTYTYNDAGLMATRTETPPAVSRPTDRQIIMVVISVKFLKNHQVFLVFYLIGASIFLCFPVFLLRWPGFQKESQAKDELPCGHFPDRIEYPLWKDD